MNLEALKPFLKDLPAEVKTKAEALVAKMEEVIEGVGDEPITWKPDFLRIVQGTTARGTGGIPKDAQNGDFVLGEHAVEQPFRFIPLRLWDGRQFWDPDPTEPRLLCSSPDAKVGSNFGTCIQCPHGKWDEVNNRADCGKVKNVLAIRDDLSDVFLISFGKTNYQTGMALEKAAKKAMVAPYRRKYSLVSQTNAKKKNVKNFALDLLNEEDRLVAGECVPFLAELFKAVNADRKFALERFYEYVESRKGRHDALPAPNDANTVLLTGEVEDGDGVATEGNVSEMAKSYSI